MPRGQHVRRCPAACRCLSMTRLRNRRLAFLVIGVGFECPGHLLEEKTPRGSPIDAQRRRAGPGTKPGPAPRNEGVGGRVNFALTTRFTRPVASSAAQVCRDLVEQDCSTASCCLAGRGSCRCGTCRDSNIQQLAHSHSRPLETSVCCGHTCLV